METNCPDKIRYEHRDSILNHIISCANCALQTEVAFRTAMDNLAKELRHLFSCEYLSFGVVIDSYAEDIFISYDLFEDKELLKQQTAVLKEVNRVSMNADNSFVTYALKSDNIISWFPNEEGGRFSFYKHYQYVLHSRSVNNSCVIPIRDKNHKNYGYIQLINTHYTIDYENDIFPFLDAFLGLAQIIINNKKNNQELIRRDNLLKDADFYNNMQDKKNDINALLDSIMTYLSKEFNAAIISFRIPLLNGPGKEPLFFLRRVFVHPSVSNTTRQELIDRYNKEWSVMHKSDMNGADKIRCYHQGHILESKSNIDLSEYGLNIDDNTLIIPIYRDFDAEKLCINPLMKKDVYCSIFDRFECISRFQRLYGIFRLRISNTYLQRESESFQIDLIETKERLSYLSKQITLLLNSIVYRYENESLQIFQTELKDSSFTKIQEFDNRCTKIIKHSVNAKTCSIYRFNEQRKLLFLSATTTDKIVFRINDNASYFEPEQVKGSCFISVKTQNNILIKALETKRSIYVLNINDSQFHQYVFIESVNNGQESAIAVPMIKKDGTCVGVVLLLGREAHKHSIATTYWEQDIKVIESIVNILVRISESDTERLTFLSHLSHEMLAPVTESVYDNDLAVNMAERNPNIFTRRQLISKLRENIDRNMLFKYIISDTEYIYSSTKKNLDYNIVRQDKSQEILLSAIRFVEKEANFNGLSIRTNIHQMPPLYFDKERIMQVFINLLKNAIKYSYRNTTIDIYYHMGNNGFHEICFANYGIGIEVKERESIFELFNRGENAKKKTVRGTGMGLYIVRNIMKAHGGDCFVKSYNYPTEFVITFPNN